VLYVAVTNLTTRESPSGRSEIDTHGTEVLTGCRSPILTPTVFWMSYASDGDDRITLQVRTDVSASPPPAADRSFDCPDVISLTSFGIVTPP
jgi:hypothetical protein